MGSEKKKSRGNCNGCDRARENRIFALKKKKGEKKGRRKRDSSSKGKQQEVVWCDGC